MVECPVGNCAPYLRWTSIAAGDAGEPHVAVFQHPENPDVGGAKGATALDYAVHGHPLDDRLERHGGDGGLPRVDRHGGGPS